jgi:hypothetical protein
LTPKIFFNNVGEDRPQLLSPGDLETATKEASEQLLKVLTDWRILKYHGGLSGDNCRTGVVSPLYETVVRMPDAPPVTKSTLF